jgi:hypothetical protein
LGIFTYRHFDVYADGAWVLEYTAHIATAAPAKMEMEDAADVVCKIFDKLTEADKEALTTRLVMLGALNTGEGPDYINRVSCNANVAMLEMIDRKIAEQEAEKRRHA